MKVSTRGDYAAGHSLSLALHADGGRPTSVRDIAERTGLPQPYLEQILLALKGAGLVRSKRGVGGGYVLAREPDEILLARSCPRSTARSSPATSASRTPTAPATTRASACSSAIWGEVGEHMRRHLDGFTLADIASMANGSKTGRRPRANRWPAGSSAR